MLRLPQAIEQREAEYTLPLESNGYPGDEFISIEEPTAKLAGKTLALSFKPATKADEDIIASRLPAPEADGSIDPAKLPKTLPGYLINLTAEFTINGETIKAGTAGKMGGELSITFKSRYCLDFWGEIVDQREEEIACWAPEH